ncbi:MAG TPA: hypothetical protein VF630_13365 [Hymenobacter sp.]|jgi:hypothetical protein
MNWDLLFKSLGALFGLATVSTAILNLLTATRRARHLQQEQRRDAQLQDNILLATRTEQRVTALESRVGSIEQRIEKRIDQISADIGKVKDLFTEYLIKH